MNIVLFLIFNLVLFYNITLYVNAVENYGPYYIKWKEYKICSSPTNSAKDVHFFSAMTERNPKSPNPIFHFNLTFMAPTHIDEAKLVSYSIKEGRKVIIQNIKIIKPCTSYPFFKLLQLFMNCSKSCIVPKGTYVFDVNFNEMAKKFVGEQFFFGEYFTRIVILSNKKFISCLNVLSEFSKPDAATALYHNQTQLNLTVF